MQIPAYIPQLAPSRSDQIDRPSDRNLPVARGQQQRARDSYQFNAAAASVIEAEYVDLLKNSARVAAPRNQASPPPQQMLQPADSAASTPAQANSALVARLQTAPADVPAPGTYLNLYA